MAEIIVPMGGWKRNAARCWKRAASGAAGAMLRIAAKISSTRFARQSALSRGVGLQQLRVRASRVSPRLRAELSEVLQAQRCALLQARRKRRCRRNASHCCNLNAVRCCKNFQYALRA